MSFPSLASSSCFPSFLPFFLPCLLSCSVLVSCEIVCFFSPSLPPFCLCQIYLFSPNLSLHYYQILLSSEFVLFLSNLDPLHNLCRPPSCPNISHIMPSLQGDLISIAHLLAFHHFEAQEPQELHRDGLGFEQGHVHPQANSLVQPGPVCLDED